MVASDLCVTKQNLETEHLLIKIVLVLRQNYRIEVTMLQQQSALRPTLQHSDEHIAEKTPREVRM